MVSSSLVAFKNISNCTGNLALSRAIGDFEFKKNINLNPEEQVVTCDPEILERVHKEGDEFFVVACDGIWDCMSSQQVMDFVSERIARGDELPNICEALTDNCLAADAMSGLGCDNMTVIICALLCGKTEEEWRQSVAERHRTSSTPGAFPSSGIN
jgi:protein phosphatase 2C family protein 2/3